MFEISATSTPGNGASPRSKRILNEYGQDRKKLDDVYTKVATVLS